MNSVSKTRRVEFDNLTQGRILTVDLIEIAAETLYIPSKEMEQMKRITKIAAFISSLAICAGLSACGSTRSGFEQTGGTQKLEKGATIGISMPTKSEERWNKDGNNLKNKLEDAGYNVVLNYADDKPAQQNADIENMVNQGAKILVVASKDGSAVGPAVEKARDAGATVIAYDRLIMNTDAVDYYATFQLEQVGKLEAEYLVDQLGLNDGEKGPFNMELFTGSPDDNNAKYFFKGAWDILQPYFEKGVLVCPSNHGGGVTKDFTVDDWQKISVQSWKTEQAQKDMESILDSTYASGRKLDAVLTPYDGIAQGVINAIEAKRPDMKPGTESWPPITGQDAMEIAVSNIAAGKQGETVFKNVDELADAVYDMIIEIAEGKKVTGINGEFNNNNVDVPSKLLDPQNITVENLDDLVKAKYLTQERFDKLTKGEAIR
ncbi:ABC transporter substrate-binding protein [Bifidobacterium pseudolongum subsp. pseudolongum]|uniref:ABC transporter substrate-binding protein n=2 Tax=Bifidobacterium pseudolongum TaxID=1694 RepID=A0A4Q5AB10_9BIFI|nr:ABC transporter substrate-binding protein [Bifidobacterium pseudolongum subsp. pseudolongum]